MASATFCKNYVVLTIAGTIL